MLTASTEAPCPPISKMAPPSKIQVLLALPVRHTNLRFYNHPLYSNQIVPGDYRQLNPVPTRVEHICAILAHTRGDAATGCSREMDGRTRVFEYTIFPAGNMPDGTPICNGCTNCWYQSEQHRCGNNCRVTGGPPGPPILRAPRPVPTVVSPVPPPGRRNPVTTGPPIRPLSFGATQSPPAPPTPPTNTSRPPTTPPTQGVWANPRDNWTASRTPPQQRPQTRPPHIPPLEWASGFRRASPGSPTPGPQASTSRAPANTHSPSIIPHQDLPNIYDASPRQDHGTGTQETEPDYSAMFPSGGSSPAYAPSSHGGDSPAHAPSSHGGDSPAHAPSTHTGNSLAYTPSAHTGNSLARTPSIYGGNFRGYVASTYSSNFPLYSLVSYITSTLVDLGNQTLALAPLS